MPASRDSLILATTGLLAVAAPAIAARHLSSRCDQLGHRLGDLTGERSSVGGVEAGLTGEVRLTDVRIGELLAIGAVEASVSMASLLDGELGADEIRLERPRLRARVDAGGDSDLARVLRKVAAARRGGGGAASKQRLRRIVVTEGDLVVEVVGLGEIEARGVELEPQPGGVRVVTGALRARLGPASVRFGRGGGDLRLPDARLDRFLAVGGSIDVASGLAVRDVALGWDVWAPGLLALRGEVDHRALALTIDPGPAPAIHVVGSDLPLGALEPLAPAALALDDARASGEVTLVRGAPSTWTASIDATVWGLGVDHPAIADRPVVLDGDLSAVVATDPGGVEVTAFHLGRGALVLDGSARIRRGGPSGVASGQLALRLADAPCLELATAIPEPLRGPLGALPLDGRLSGELAIRFDLEQPAGEGVELDATLANGCVALDEPPGADVRTLIGVADHRFPGGDRAPVGPGVGDWTPLVSVPAYVDGAFVAAEDARFADHHGFDTEQIARSLEVDLREGRFARGGSTISQQLVKNAFLDHRRSLARKLQEAVLTWRLEERLGKRQILERYLNVIELGPGVYGIAAAARHWFGKSPASLSIREAAFLAAMTPEPVSMSRRIAAAGGLDPQSADRVETVLRHMARGGWITEQQQSDARHAGLALRRDAVAATTGT